MEKNKVRFITRTALMAAAYAAITIVFSGMSYGQVQFRISEILVLFAFIDAKYAPGLILGCFLANLPSPLGIIDVVIGTLATTFAVLFIIQVKKVFGYNKKALILSSLGPVVFNALLVGWELEYLFQTAFWMNALYVAIGEFAVVTIAGTIIVSAVMENERITDKLKLEE